MSVSGFLDAMPPSARPIPPPTHVQLWALLESSEPPNAYVLASVADKIHQGWDPFLPDPEHENFSALAKAVQNGKIELIRLFLSSPSSSEKIDLPVGPHGQTALQIACSQGPLSIVQMLIDSGASLETRDASGNTPLHHAAIKGTAAIVEFILSLDHCTLHCLRAQVHKGLSALDLACKNKHPEIAKQLIAKGAFAPTFGGNKQTALHYAAFNGQTEIVALLLAQEGARAPEYLDAKTVNGNEVPLHYACGKGYLEIAHMLLNAGANTTITSDDGLNALHWAVHSNNTEILHRLLTQPNLCTDTLNGRGGSNKETALSFACSLGHIESVRALVRAGACPHVTDLEGNNPLHVSIINKDEEIVAFLLEECRYSEGKINALHERTGLTPIQYACHHGNLNIVQMLIAAGASPSARINKITPMHFAVLAGHKEVVSFLLRDSRYCLDDLNAPQEGGNTLLQSACSEGHLKIAQELLTAGCSPDSFSPSGHKPLYLATFPFQSDPLLFISISLWLQKLEESADYKNPQMRQTVAIQVLSILEFAKENNTYLEEFRRVMEQAGSTCSDRSMLALNELNLILKIQQMGKEATDDAILDLLKGAFALHLLEQIAAVTIARLPEADPIEVLLGYQVQLREKLNLPLNCKSMLFYRCSDLTPNDIALAEQEVKALIENRIAFLDFLMGRDVSSISMIVHPQWIARLDAKYNDKITALRDLFYNEHEKLIDCKLEMKDDDFLNEVNANNENCKKTVAEWYEKKTRKILGIEPENPSCQPSCSSGVVP